MDTSDTEITLTLTATEAAAIVCGLGLVAAMLGDDGEPPRSVLAMIDRLRPEDALWMCLKVRHAVETQIMGMET